MTMSMIIVTATLSFDSETARDRAVEVTVPVQAATRRDEPGCLAYCFAADPVEVQHIQVFERWTDGASLAAHFGHLNYKAMVDVLRTSGGFVHSDNRMYVADDRGGVYDDAGVFRGDALS